MLYRCVYSFRDSRGNDHWRGDYITTQQYADLKSFEQFHFEAQGMLDTEDLNDDDDPTINDVKQ